MYRDVLSQVQIERKLNDVLQSLETLRDDLINLENEQHVTNYDSLLFVLRDIVRESNNIQSDVRRNKDAMLERLEEDEEEGE